MTDSAIPPGAPTPWPGALPAVQPNGHWKEWFKWALAAIVALITFVFVTFSVKRQDMIEARQIDTDKKVERLDQKIDDVKAGVERIEKKLDR